MIKSMSSKFNEKDVEKLVDKMSMRFKMRLARKLAKETRERRWSLIFKHIDQRFKKSPLTEDDIAKEVAAVRKSKNAKSRR